MINKIIEHKYNIMIVLAGLFFITFIHQFFSFLSVEDKLLIKYKDEIKNSDRTLKEMELKKIKVEEFRECNISKLNGLINGKANETNCQNIFKEKSFEPLSLIFTKTYADDEKITYENLTISGSTKPPFKIYSMLKDECFVQDVLNKKHCIRTGLSINYAESSFNSLDLGLTCEDKSVKNWVKKYKKWWYKAQDGHFFYGDWGELGKSHYCTSELSSGSKKGCPFGKINFDSIFFNLKF